MALPMNPQSKIFPAAPGEADLELMRPYQHAHRPTRSDDRPLAGREAIRFAYQSLKIGYMDAAEALHSMGMSWEGAHTYLLVD